MSGNEPDCDCSKCGCSLESDAYARGKAYGMAEARKLDYTEESMRIGGDIELAKVVAWLREKAKRLLADAAKLSEEPWPKFHESRAVDMAADALERGEHKK